MCSELILALILGGGTHEGGRQYDVLRTYVENGAPSVARGTFYAWFTAPLLALLTEMLERAIALGQQQPRLLPGILAGVTDWRVVDSDIGSRAAQGATYRCSSIVRRAYRDEPQARSDRRSVGAEFPRRPPVTQQPLCAGTMP